MNGFTIVPQGAFSLRESVEFGFGQRHSERWSGVMRMAFCLDGYVDQVGVTLRQDDAGVHGVVSGEADVGAVRDQVARVLSLDHDATPYEEIGTRDPVIARLQQLAPGLRPPLFYSPYEAAVWAILSTRRPPRAAADLRGRLCETHGRTFDLDGVGLAALPTPGALLVLRSFPGLSEDRIPRLHGVAEAALAGRLDARALLAMGPEAATESLLELKGIGPFYSSLITIRGTGFADVLVDREPRLLALVQRLYGLVDTPGPEELATLADAWRPMRTWAAVLIRAAGARQ